MSTPGNPTDIARSDPPDGPPPISYAGLMIVNTNRSFACEALSLRTLAT